jgi:hypothetical protein
MARFGEVSQVNYPVKSITIRSDWNKNVGGLGRPLNCALFTYNKNSGRLEHWGSRGTTYSMFANENQAVEGDPDFIGPLPAAGGGTGPIAGEELGLGDYDLYEPSEGWPDWMPDGFRIIQSGFKGDGLALGGNPQGGHLGLRGDPVLVEVDFDMPESESGGLVLGLQCDLDPGGSPHDVGVMVAYHHYWPVGQRAVVKAGGGLFLQATNDLLAGGQEGDWTGHHHPYPFIEIKLENAVDGLHEDGGLYFDVRVGLDLLRGEPFLGGGLGWGF